MDNTNLNLVTTNKSQIADRLNRVISAIYWFTGHLDSHEPLRWNIRSHAITMQEASLSYMNTSPVTDRDNLKVIKDKANRLVSLIRLLVITNFLDLEQEKLIRDEIMSLINDLEKSTRVETQLGTYDLEKIMRELPSYTHLVEPSDNSRNELTGRLKGADANKGLGVGFSTFNSRNEMDRRGLGGDSHSSAGDERQAKIASFIGKNGPSNVRDVAGVIKGCSDKTLQRILVQMVELGVLKREGERRWSRYSMAKSG